MLEDKFKTQLLVRYLIMSDLLEAKLSKLASKHSFIISGVLKEFKLKMPLCMHAEWKLFNALRCESVIEYESQLMKIVRPAGYTKMESSRLCRKVRKCFALQLSDLPADYTNALMIVVFALYDDRRKALKSILLEAHKQGKAHQQATASSA